jgi:hypothetical protein
LGKPKRSTGKVNADRTARIAVKMVIDTLPAAPTATNVIFCCFSEAGAAASLQG